MWGKGFMISVPELSSFFAKGGDDFISYAEVLESLRAQKGIVEVIPLP